LCFCGFGVGGHSLCFCGFGVGGHSLCFLWFIKTDVTIFLNL
jgi:hypothetical protein